VVEYSHWVVRGCRYPTAIFTAPLPSLRAYQHYDLMQDILNRDYTQLVRRPRRPEKTYAARHTHHRTCTRTRTRTRTTAHDT
jgi:DNA-directed RNA polymerase specialized sigma24 family protein